MNRQDVKLLLAFEIIDILYTCTQATDEQWATIKALMEAIHTLVRLDKEEEEKKEVS